jgi:outer membrane protein OmpA-like peptidoglycan-associated protein
VVVAPKIEDPKPAPPVAVEQPKIEEAAPPPIEKPILPTTPLGKPAETVVEIVPETKPAPVQETTPPIQETTPVVVQPTVVPTATSDLAILGSFTDFSRKLEESSLAVCERFRLDGAVFDPLVWQLTPRIIGPLDKLVSQLKIYPSLQIEISAHTEALGVDEDNLRISESRINTVLDYMVKEGIAKERILAKGCGETMPVNHCRNGTNCSFEEHLANQRIEVKVLALDGKG